ncbi:hypothetical protein GMB86_05480 [Terrilactibacillus sp. BCM23-1]|uniref:Uncharacterized protein n=1 Tax=Terrilactibacillus tamarindi TaxID=2599694 RepID=A0A6N8CPE7_9BACI|nr:hypothetical protein [Terrilactibacillus tamarindi]MTT31470.1 hypothetical protein [Terrilactibacillus tamarindi]
MKSFTENEKNLSNMENGEKDKINRMRIEQMASAYNHQERVAHVDKTVVQFNAMFARLKASKNGEK